MEVPMQATEQAVEMDDFRLGAPLGTLIPGGEVLDLACGSGRHARHLVTLGHPVIALDRDPEMLEKAAGPGITTSLVDLEAPAPSGRSRPGALPASSSPTICTGPCRAMLASLAPNGVLLYETFAKAMRSSASRPIRRSC
jgi:SAM-dependent methyltransferase